MSAYSLVLFLHSWLRWAVVGLAIALLAHSLRARAAAKPDDKPGPASPLSPAFIGAVHTQLLLGFLLYFALSPMTRAAFADMRTAMRTAPLRFFAVEHLTAMLLAAAIAQVCSSKAKRAATAVLAHTWRIRGAGSLLFLVLVGMPWPFMKYGRPLARGLTVEQAATSAAGAGGDVSPADLDRAREAFASRCAGCHGTTGQGDGPAAAALTPRPRSFRDEAWQRQTSDERIERVLVEGGAALGLSGVMPPQPDLRGDRALLRGLRAYVRSLQR